MLLGVDLKFLYFGHCLQFVKRAPSLPPQLQLSRFVQILQNILGLVKDVNLSDDVMHHAVKLMDLLHFTTGCGFEC